MWVHLLQQVRLLAIIRHLTISCYPLQSAEIFKVKRRLCDMNVVKIHNYKYYVSCRYFPQRDRELNMKGKNVIHWFYCKH